MYKTCSVRQNLFGYDLLFKRLKISMLQCVQHYQNTGRRFYPSFKVACSDLKDILYAMNFIYSTDNCTQLAVLTADFKVSSNEHCAIIATGIDKHNQLCCVCTTPCKLSIIDDNNILKNFYVFKFLDRVYHFTDSDINFKGTVKMTDSDLLNYFCQAG